MKYWENFKNKPTHKKQCYLVIALVFYIFGKKNSGESKEWLLRVK